MLDIDVNSLNNYTKVTFPTYLPEMVENVWKMLRRENESWEVVKGLKAYQSDSANEIMDF